MVGSSRVPIAGGSRITGLRVLDVVAVKARTRTPSRRWSGQVIAVDCSALALRNARVAWPKDSIDGLVPMCVR